MDVENLPITSLHSLHYLYSTAYCLYFTKSLPQSSTYKIPSTIKHLRQAIQSLLFRPFYLQAPTFSCILIDNVCE